MKDFSTSSSKANGSSLNIYVFLPVLGIRIRMFLSLPDPQTDPIVTSTDPSIIKQKE
jgi:hypothetical protein